MSKHRAPTTTAAVQTRVLRRCLEGYWCAKLEAGTVYLISGRQIRYETNARRYPLDEARYVRPMSNNAIMASPTWATDRRFENAKRFGSSSARNLKMYYLVKTRRHNRQGRLERVSWGGKLSPPPPPQSWKNFRCWLANWYIESAKFLDFIW